MRIFTTELHFLISVFLVLSVLQAKQKLPGFYETEQTFNIIFVCVDWFCLFFLISAINRDVPIRDYPAGTVLLETCMRYGKISHQAQDVVQQVGRWRPSNENESDLMERHKQTPEATVRFITDGNGAIRCVVVDVTPYWRKFLVKLSPRPLFLHCMFVINGFWGIFRCIRTMWVWFCNWFWG